MMSDIITLCQSGIVGRTLNVQYAKRYFMYHHVEVKLNVAVENVVTNIVGNLIQVGRISRKVWFLGTRGRQVIWERILHLLKRVRNLGILENQIHMHKMKNTLIGKVVLHHLGLDYGIAISIQYGDKEFSRETIILARFVKSMVDIWRQTIIPSPSSKSEMKTISKPLKMHWFVTNYGT